jgi:hypothetical protein
MKWKLLAPFTNVERKGFDEVFPPEKEINLSANYTGKNNAPITWQDFESKDDYGMVDFNKPFDMLKEAGVDMTTPAPFAAAMKEMNRILDTMEAILDRREGREGKTPAK